MNITRHAAQRMSQRGIDISMIDIVMREGNTMNNNDKVEISRKEAEAILLEKQQMIRILTNEVSTIKKIIDKGGCTVVAAGDNIVTTYNSASYRRNNTRKKISEQKIMRRISINGVAGGFA